MASMSGSNGSPTLTSHLFNLPSIQSQFSRGIYHSFLRNAGGGTLPGATLNHWMVQEIHCQRAYVRFIGSMLAQIRLPIASNNEGSVLHKVFDLLVAALNGTQGGMRFCEETLRKYHLRPVRNVPVGHITRAYKDLLGSFADGGRSALLEGMVVLWAVEMCHFNAWSYAARIARSEEVDLSQGGPDGNATLALQEALIPAWSNPEGGELLKGYENVVNEFAEFEGIRVTPENEGKEHYSDQLIGRCEEVFRHVLWLQERFWPE